MRTKGSRSAVRIIGAVMLAGAAAAASAQPPAFVNVASRAMPVTAKAGNYELVNQVVDLPPGSAVPRHSHGGPVVVTVLSGELTLIEGGSERVVKTGESWTEKVGYVHAVTNKGATTVRIAASYLIPKGATEITMAK